MNGNKQESKNARRVG